MDNQTTINTLPDRAIADAYEKAAQAFHSIPEGPGCIPAAERAFESTLLEEVASLAEAHGLVLTLRTLHRFNQERPIQLLPPALEPLLEGHKSRWVWLNNELRRYEAKLWRSFDKKYFAEHGDHPSTLTRFESGPPRIWLGLLTEHKLDDSTYAMWSHLEIDSIEEGVAELFSRVVTEQAIFIEKELTISDLAGCQIHFNDEISFTLPEWEATAILEKELENIRENVEDAYDDSHPPGYKSEAFLIVADLYEKFI